VFNLVGKRYLFLIISLIVIIPGTVSLIVKGLNVGIDFKGGTNIEVRPDHNVSIAEMTGLLRPLNLSNLQVVTGADNNVPGNGTVWVRLNTQIDTNVQGTVTSDLRNAFGSQLNVNFDDLSLDGKTATIVTITKFNKAPQVAAVEKALSNLPNTSNPAKGPPTTAAPTPTPTASVTGTPTATTTGTPAASKTPTATATAQPTATGTATTAKGTPTATATPTANTNPANIPVKVMDVHQGSTTETVTVLTLSVVNPADLLKLESTLINNGNLYIQVLDNASVTGSVAAQTTQNAFLAVLAASVLILLYIWFSFRKVAKPWRYGACAIIALLHDVLVVCGVFSILGWLFDVQISALFITALLTVVGFSVHDTIVVFDRIRENMQRRTTESFEQVVNASLVQTLARSLNTSLTVLITLSALTVFGGVTIREFTLALLIGVFSGTYSSIFNASMLLVIWEKGELGTSYLSRDRGRRVDSGRSERELARTRG
jgi:preprotein translocase SecF subunit